MELFFNIETVLTLNWISWIRTAWLNWIAWNFFTIKLYLHLNYELMLNSTVWNKTIFLKIDLALNNLQMLICHKTQTANQPINNKLKGTTCFEKTYSMPKMADW